MPRDMLASSPDESFLLRTLEILRRRRGIATVVFLAVFVSAVSFARYLPDLYKASAVVLVERQLPETFVRAAVSGELESRLHVIKQEVLSRTRVTELVRRFDLYSRQRARGDMETVLDRVRQDIHVEPTGPEQLNGRMKTVAFNLTFTAASRERVAEVTNAIAAFYIEQNNRMRSEEARRTMEFLKAQLDAAKQELEKQEGMVRAYTTQHVGQLPTQADVNLATLERLNTQLRLNGERQLRTIEAREKLLENVPPTAAIGTSAAAAAESPVAARLERLRAELRQFEAKGTDKHPDVRRLRDEIAKAEAELKANPIGTNGHSYGDGNGNGNGNGNSNGAHAPAPAQSAAVPTGRGRMRTIDALDAELEKLKSDEATLRQTIAMWERRLEGVPFRQTEFAQVSRDHQGAKDVYDSLLRRYEEAQVAASMETENQGERFRVLEAAVPPEGPSAPNRPRLLILGFLLAVLFAGFAVLLVEQFDTSFHTVDDLRHFTTVPVLGAIPRIGGVPAKRRMRTVLAAVAAIVGLAVIAAGSAWMATGNEELVRLIARS